MKAVPVAVFPAGTSAAEDQTGSPVRAYLRNRISLNAMVVGGSSTGQFKVQVSSHPTDQSAQVPDDSWSDLPGSGLPAGSTRQTTLPIEVCANWLRVVYKYGAGLAGTLDAALMVQGQE